ncbi:MAG: cytochrome c [Sulfurovaceae bacterium]|nr:cytochrome c [Sulfurovaceae bacterium]MDD5547986.1 cytochrome c [Sulfurovaceae bacterium]
MKKILIACCFLTLIAQCDDMSDGKKLYDSKCAICHTSARPNSMAEMNALIAPPMEGLMFHLKTSFNTKEESNKFMKDYIMNPTKEKALCMPQKIQKFGLMPSQKGVVTEDELDKIIAYLSEQYK